MTHRVIFSPESEEQLTNIYRFIMAATSPQTAERYTDSIIDYCESLKTFPHRGTKRDDIRQGLRITNYKRNTVIAFSVDETQVNILGIFYGGQNYEASLSPTSNQDDLQ